MSKKKATKKTPWAGITAPKTLFEFAKNLEAVLLDVPLSNWLGRLYGHDVKTGKTVVKSQGCLVQQALTADKCRSDQDPDEVFGNIGTFIKALPALQPYAKELHQMTQASDACNFTEAVEAVREFEKTVGFPLDASRLGSVRV